MLAEQLLLQAYLADHAGLAARFLGVPRCPCTLCADTRRLPCFRLAQSEPEVEVAHDFSSGKGGQAPPDDGRTYDRAAHSTTPLLRIKNTKYRGLV